MTIVTDREKAMYFDARDRAIHRIVEEDVLRKQTMIAFDEGLKMAFNSPNPSTYLFETEFEPETNYAFSFVSGVLAKLEAIKAKSYRSSWMKNGFLGVFENIRRKFDRVEISMTASNPVDHPCIEDLGDIAVYAMKEINRRARLNPAEFKAWIKNIQELKEK